jgi:cholesterol transport system auxiliary component
MTKLPRRWVLAVLALTPASCSLLPQPAAPPKLYTLTPAVDFPPGGARVTWQLLIDPPIATAALDTSRIALSRDPISVDYFADSAWVDRAPVMLQALLVESFENSRRISAVARDSSMLRADYMLLSELRHFEADYRAGALPTARVALGVKLVRADNRAVIAEQTFAAATPAATNDIPAIIQAFNAAFHQVARQITEWTLASAR